MRATNKKHAYCIIAHNRPDLLQNLVEMLDDKRNDIFIHIDKKVDLSLFSNINAQKSNLIFCKKRIDTIWGHVSQVYTELQLFEVAISHGDYSYVHLLSGIDIPIKSQDYIHEFCNKSEFEYIGYWHNERNLKTLRRRIELYHILTHKGRTTLGYVYSQIRRAFCVLQRAFGFKRKHLYRKFGIGPNWASLTGECVKYILSQKDLICKEFSYTTCIDEVYKHTIILNSRFREKVYYFKAEKEVGSMRLVDWERGNPYTYQMSDINEIMNSDRWFCRKVTDINLAKEIKRRICQH